MQEEAPRRALPALAGHADDGKADMSITSKACTSTAFDSGLSQPGGVRMSFRRLKGYAARVGYPATIHVDSGSEFIFRALDLWAYANNVTPDFLRPGKATR